MTGVDTLSTGRLTLLNALRRDGEAAHLAEVEAGANAEVHVEVHAEVHAEVARDQPAISEPGVGSHLIGLNDGPIRSRVQGDIGGGEPGDEFQPEDGQQWNVPKPR